MRPTPEEIATFNMPSVDIGTPIVWYPKGEKAAREVEVGFIMHSGARTVTLYTSRGRRIDAVRHVDDPKLNLSVEQREMGAWDYTPESKRITVLEDLVAKLIDDRERAVAEAVEYNQEDKSAAKPKRRTGGAGAKNLNAWHKLQMEAKDLGISVRNVKKDELVKLIEERKREIKEAEEKWDPSQQISETIKHEAELPAMDIHT